MALQNETLDKLVSDWNTRVQELKGAFVNQASQLAQWDVKLINLADNTNKLANTVGKLEGGVTDLEKQLQSVEAYQTEFSNTLNAAEASLDKRLDAMKKKPTQDQSLTQAEALFEELQKIQATLFSVGSRIQLSESSGESISGMLNDNLNALLWIKDNVAMLDKEMSKR